MQTKLSVALAATLAGFALSAQAANVEVYGLIDTGLNYQHVDATAPASTTCPSSR